MLKRLRGVVAIVSATALASTPLLLSPTGASASVAPTTSRAAMPTITATVRPSGVALKGVAGLHAGTAKLVVKGKGRDSVTFGTLKKGYTMEMFTKDLVAGFVKNDLKAVTRIYARADAIGGLAPGDSGSITFPHPGNYFAFTFGRRGPSEPVTFRVGAKRTSKRPHADATIIGADGPAWKGSASLPAKGTLRFKNTATRPVLHFLELTQVVEGTTVDQALEAFQSDGRPDFVVRGGGVLRTDVISPHRSMTVDYDLPPGQYLVTCFMPDPKTGGMPHALMGMMEMIHLT